MMFRDLSPLAASKRREAKFPDPNVTNVTVIVHQATVELIKSLAAANEPKRPWVRGDCLLISARIYLTESQI